MKSCFPLYPRSLKFYRLNLLRSRRHFGSYFTGALRTRVVSADDFGFDGHCFIFRYNPKPPRAK